MAAIEPISSMMTIQAQPVQPASSSSSSSESTAKPAQEFVSSGQEVPQIDPKTLVVSNTAESSEENASSYGQGTASEAEESIQRQNEKVKKAVEELNKKMDNSNSIAQFGIHEATNRVTIKIVDKDSKKVIKELPPEKTLDMIAKVWELAGLMVDERR